MSSSLDPIQMWNVVGTWVAGLATVGAVVVSLYLARQAERLQRKTELKRNAAELYAMFADMEVARHEAGDILRKNAKLAEPLSFQQMHNQTPRPSSLGPVSRLLHFWERTTHLLDGFVRFENYFADGK